MQTIMPPIDTADNLFHDGDPTLGIEGTIVTAEHLNNEQSATRDIQQELINVLALAAMEPDPSKQNQLAEAISSIIGGKLPDTIVSSVNEMSGDVTLTAESLGALPEKDYKPRRDALGTFLVGDSINNANAFALTPGTYGRYMVSTTKNLPDEVAAAGVGNVYLECMATYTNGNMGLVFLYPITDQFPSYFAYVNLFSHDAIGGWHKVYDSLFPPTAEECGAAPASHTHAPEVGQVLFFKDATINPAAIYLGTTWSRVAVNQHVRGAAEGEAGGITGGSDTSALSIDHMPYHAHTVDSHAHTVPDHTHKQFVSGFSDYGASIAEAPDSPPAASGIKRTVSDRDDYQILASVGGNWCGVTSPAGSTNTGGATPGTSAVGAGAAFSVLNAFVKLHIWERIS